MLGSMKVTFFLLGFLVLTIVSSAFSPRAGDGQSQSQNIPSQDYIERQRKQWADLEGQFPVVDYDAADADATGDSAAKRKARNSRYDKRNLVSKDPTPRIVESASVNEGPAVTALPTAKSDLVVVCDVLASAAHLSNNKRGIYTDLAVKVSEVIKNNTPIRLDSGAIVTAEREGGFVRYSNGHRRLYRMQGEGMPKPGRRYLLFLIFIPDTQDFYILTGYELSQTGVVPVDPSHHSAVYEGHAVDAFLDLVRSSPSQPE